MVYTHTIQFKHVVHVAHVAHDIENSDKMISNTEKPPNCVKNFNIQLIDILTTNHPPKVIRSHIKTFT